MQRGGQQQVHMGSVSWPQQPHCKRADASELKTLVLQSCAAHGIPAEEWESASGACPALRARRAQHGSCPAQHTTPGSAVGAQQGEWRALGAPQASPAHAVPRHCTPRAAPAAALESAPFRGARVREAKPASETGSVTFCSSGVPQKETSTSGCSILPPVRALFTCCRCWHTARLSSWAGALLMHTLLAAGKSSVLLLRQTYKR